MSNTVDNRVVQMKFDNADFEKNVQTSMTTLSKLNKSLDMTESSRGFENISAAANRMDLGGISNGVETLKMKFSALEVIAVTALANIANSALNVGKNITSALTVDPIKTGFSEYETQINAVQTILANTSSKGTTLDDVSKALDELNTYADKTIYNFTEMTRNIGTFTAAGVDLKTSTNAIKGIANLAAVSGSNAQQASTAMYQLSQAMASGTVKLMDWNSVVNAGMGGQVFQDALKETAKAHGLSVDKMIAKDGSFRETLQRGWLTTEILTETLSKFTGDLNAEQLKTMGYTDDQIKGILKMGQTANDAATKVKTFTQLFDTLKEAAQSGWAQSWKIVIGDFNEAKELLTTLSNSFGAIIGASSNARNSMLQGWKDLGGRTVLIEALKNAMDGIASIIKPISEAFREVFPPTTGKQLYDLTVGFEKLTSLFKLNAEESNNLKSVFKGLFSTISLIGKAFTGLFVSVSPLLGVFGYIGSGILSVISVMGEWITQLNSSISGFQFFTINVQDIASAIQWLADAIKGQFVAPGLDKLSVVIDLLSEKFKMLKDYATATFDQLKSGASDSVGEANIQLQKFLTVIDNIKNVLSGFSSKLKEALAPIGAEIQDAFKDVTITDAIGTGMIAGIITVIIKVLKNFDKVTATFGDAMNSVVKVLNTACSALETWQNNLRADTLFKIAAAVALLAVSVIALSFVDVEKLKNGIQGVTILLGEVVATLEVLSKWKVTGVASAAASMVVLSIAISILAGAMAKLKVFQSWKQTWPAILAMSALMYGLTAAISILSESFDGKDAVEFIKVTAGILLFSFAMQRLAIAMVSLSTLNPAQVATGLVSITGLLAGISSFCKGLESLDFTKLSGGVGIILALATSMIILSVAVKIISTIPFDELMVGLGTVMLLLTTISVMMKYIGSMNIQGGFATIMGMAIALNLLIIPIKVLSAMPLDKLMIGMGSVMLLLASMAVMLKYVGSMNAKGGFATIMGMAIALNLLIAPIAILGNMPWPALLVGLGSVLLLLATMTVMMTSLAPLGPALLMVSGAFALFGLAIYGVGAGMASFALGLAAFVAIGVAGVTTLGLMMTALIPIIQAMIPALMSLVVRAMACFAQSIADSAPIFGEALIVVIKTFLKVIQDVIPAIVETLIILYTRMLESTLQYAPRFIEAGYQLILAFMQGFSAHIEEIAALANQIMINWLNGVASNLEGVIAAGTQVIVAFIQGVASASVQLVEAAFQAMITFINGLADCIDRNTPVLVAAIDRLTNSIIRAMVYVLTHNISTLRERGSAMIEGMKSGIGDKIEAVTGTVRDIISNAVSAVTGAIGDFRNAGANIIDGLINGIGDKFKDAVDKASDLGNQILQAAKDALGIKSPSKEFKAVGRWSVLGLVKGLEQYASLAYGAASDVATGAVDAMQNTFGGVSNIIDGNFDTNPVIRPTLDLSNITNGARQINSMFNNQKLGVNGEIGQNGGAGLVGANYNFVQNNYSPKALSRTEIYRQTSNQFATLKGAVNNA